ncbi:MAG: ATP-binding cassette domain-containing protein [Bacteroidota bacterium]
MNSLKISQLSHSFNNRKLLDTIGFSLKTGEILSIFGRNGCGKSTLLKILFSTQKADAITMLLNEQKILSKEIIPRKIIAYLPQENFLPRNTKVRDIIPMYYKGDEQDKVFYAPGIDKIAHTKAGNLSLGELRYLELLLVGNLDHLFLMLDEPFSMVEPLFKEKIKEFLKALQKQKGIIVTDHYYKDVLEISTRNMLLKNSILLPINSVNELITEGYLPSKNI